MGTKEIIEEIKKLPVNKRILIVEKTLRSIRESDIQDEMSIAAESMIDEYRNNKELTAFTELDYEEF